jgi:hypothetical protein
MATVDPASLAIDVALNPAGGILNAIRGVSPRFLASRTAEEMAPALSTQGVPNIQRLLQQMQTQPQDLLGAMAARRVPIAGGLLGQEMFGE